MNFFRRAVRYCWRQKIRSIILLLVFTFLASAALIALSVGHATGFLLAFLLWLLCSDTVNGLLFGALAQGTGTAALQTGGSTSNYLQPDLLHSGILFAGELGAVLLTVLAASGTILRLKPKEILTRMS